MNLTKATIRSEWVINKFSARRMRVKKKQSRFVSSLFVVFGRPAGCAAEKDDDKAVDPDC